VYDLVLIYKTLNHSTIFDGAQQAFNCVVAYSRN